MLSSYNDWKRRRKKTMYADVLDDITLCQLNIWEVSAKKVNYVALHLRVFDFVKYSEWGRISAQQWRHGYLKDAILRQTAMSLYLVNNLTIGWYGIV